MTKRIADLHYF